MTGQPVQPVQTCGQHGGVSTNGQPCGAQLGLGEHSGLCIWHDPGRAKEMLAQREASKRMTREEQEATFPKDLPPPPQTIADAVRYASWCVDSVARGVLAGGIDPKRAREVITGLRQFQSAAHEAELAARIKSLESQLRAYKAKAAKKGGGTVR